MSDASDLRDAAQALHLSLAILREVSESLAQSALRLGTAAQDIEQGPVVQELHQQIAELQSERVAREQFIADLQKETTSQVIALMSDAKARAGPGAERQQARMARLIELASSPRPRGGPNAPA
jgi:hypothetical protein